MSEKQMGRPDFVAAARKKFGLTLPVAEEVVSWLFETIADQVVGGGSVVIRGFGTFHPRYHPPSRRFDIRAGVTVTTAGKITMHFSPGAPLLERLKDATPPESNRST